MPKTLLKRFIRTALACLLLLGTLGLLSHQRLPDVDRCASSQRLPVDPDGPLARRLLPQIARHPGASGIFPLSDGRAAFSMRLALVEAARHTLDIQYYIWHDDISGRLLMQRLYQAADRGVRVRRRR